MKHHSNSFKIDYNNKYTYIYMCDFTYLILTTSSKTDNTQLKNINIDNATVRTNKLNLGNMNINTTTQQISGGKKS